jgi:hypothetical protein
MLKLSVEIAHSTGIPAACRGELWCLPILVKTMFEVWSVNGILLTRSSSGAGLAKDLGIAVYQRAGYFTVSGQDSPGIQLFQGLERNPIMII